MIELLRTSFIHSSGKTHIEGAELLVQKREEYLSITEMAKLRNVTTETLRHYDRIGLLPPDYINEHNVRFYSVLKYEKLGTIKELKQLGMSLSEIKAYFENRNYQSSRELLQRQNGLVRNKMKSLIYLQKKIESKICFMDSLEDCIKIGKPYIKILPKRYYISSESKVGNEIELAYEAMQLERKVYENERCLPIYATARYGGIFSLEERNDKSVQIIMFLESFSEMLDASSMPEGKYLCIQKQGSFWEWKETIQQLKKIIQDENYKVEKPIIIENVLVDYTITDIEEERIFEFQVPIC